MLGAALSSDCRDLIPQGPCDLACRAEPPRREQLEQLLRDVSRSIVDTGPRGFFRGVQALQAVAVVGQGYLQSLQRGVQEPPQVRAAHSAENYVQSSSTCCSCIELSQTQQSVQALKLEEVLLKPATLLNLESRNGLNYKRPDVVCLINVIALSKHECLAKFCLTDFLSTRTGWSDQPASHVQVVLRKLFEQLGATYVKLGQFIASSPSLFPAEYVLEFQKCLDKTDPVDWAIIKNTIEAELGRSVNQVFSYIDPVPLASASIAQVHSAGGAPQCGCTAAVCKSVLTDLSSSCKFAGGDNHADASTA